MKSSSLSLPLAFVLFLTFSLSAFSQETEQYGTSFDLGYGTNFEGAGVNVGMSLINKIDFFVDYCRFFDNDRSLYNDISFKIGKHISFYRFSSISFAGGLALLMNTSKSVNNYLYRPSSEDKFIPKSLVTAFPIYVKLNLGIYKGFGMGLKYTHNLALTDEGRDMNSVMIYITCMIK